MFSTFRVSGVFFDLSTLPMGKILFSVLLMSFDRQLEILQAKTWTCWNRSRGGHKNDQRSGTPLLWGKAMRVGAVQPGKEQAVGITSHVHSVLKGGL